MVCIEVMVSSSATLCMLYVQFNNSTIERTKEKNNKIEKNLFHFIVTPQSTFEFDYFELNGDP